MLGLFSPCDGFAQADPRLAVEWGAMFRRIDESVAPFQRELGLDSHWRNYCQTMVNLEESRAPKQGSPPLGVDWPTLDEVAFRASLSALESYRISALKLCLADVKARLRAAGSGP
jgi:hypothetical protein